ncbi:MAG: hypothetical protein ACRC68_06375 [Clostridium sp.]
MIIIDNKAKSNIVYILSYVLPMIFYPLILMIIFGVNVQIANEIYPSGGMDILMTVVIVLEMSASVSSINYIAYIISRKYLEEEENKKIFKRLVIVNTIIIAFIALIFMIRVK